MATVIDPLSEVLRSVRLTGGIFLDAQFTTPWCVRTNILAEDCAGFLVKPALLIAYHFVIAGGLLLSVDEEPTIEVRAGEIVLLPRNDVHTLASTSGLAPTSARSLIQPSADGGLARVLYGGGGEATHIVCGFLGSEETYNPLIAALPRVLKLDITEGVSRDWVEASVRYAASELTTGKLASSGLMSRLSETLFVEAMRQYSVTLTGQAGGWLKGVADPQIGRALAAIHHNIRSPWSTDSLAREASMSRSAFVDRFTALIGMPPIRYLTNWRLQTAKRRLRETRKTIAQIAEEVGYGSDEAFSRAFKRELGSTPSKWRDQQSVDERPAKR
ncbi:AraC family transcriptional regulator [Phenylobacterium sp. 20VBR1]|uniref:AraC family transcriptional regulator n=1 Tax=Phenylobacterium glaciei TaxID=2803784 RepID=A0A941HUR6_9CAUL|nr:AraC family transcriptional regulator [Phenylobacterium glaciei]